MCKYQYICMYTSTEHTAIIVEPMVPCNVIQFVYLFNFVGMCTFCRSNQREIVAKRRKIYIYCHSYQCDCDELFTLFYIQETHCERRTSQILRASNGDKFQRVRAVKIKYSNNYTRPSIRRSMYHLLNTLLLVLKTNRSNRERHLRVIYICINILLLLLLLYTYDLYLRLTRYVGVPTNKY